MIQHFSLSENVAWQRFVKRIVTFLKIFQGFSLFSYQCSFTHVLFCYAFFVYRSSRSAWLYYHDVSLLSTLFYIFFKKYFQANGEGGIWTLAPLLTTCTLSRGVPSASLGTSPNSCSNTRSIEFCVRLYIRKRILSNSFLISVTA